MKLLLKLVSVGIMVVSAYASAQSTPTIQAISSVSDDRVEENFEGNSPNSPYNATDIIDLIPKSIGIFTYKSAQIYPNAELGYVLRYQTPLNGWADVYVYPVPADLKNSPQQDIVKSMVVSAVLEIFEAQKQGMYEDFTVEEHQFSVINDHFEGRVYASFVVRDKKASTSLYLTEHNGQLFKMRLTQPNVRLENIEPFWDNFKNKIFKFLITQSDKTAT